MMLSRAVRNMALRPAHRTHMAQSSKLNVSVDGDGIATMRLNRAPCNALDLDTLRDLKSSLDDLARNGTRGLILTSALPSAFSSGLDVMELYKMKPARGREFWEALQNVWLMLFGSDFVTVAAINGEALAAGCMLALACECRVMTSQATMGLNDAAVGLVPPTWSITTMSHIIPIRQTELALTRGQVFTANEALDIGLTDYIAEDNTKAIRKCKEIMKMYDNISLAYHSDAKRTIRSGVITEFMENREKDTEYFLNFFANPEVQKGLENFIQTYKFK